MPRNVLLITTAFPSESVTEEVFVTPDVEALSREFDRVIIAPLLLKGNAKKINIPNVTVDYTIARHIFTRFKPSKLPYLLSPYVISKYRKIAKESRSFKQFLDKSIYCLNVAIHRKMLEQITRRHNLDQKSTVYYTFWFDYATAALSLMPSCVYVSRAHGYDVYDTRYGKYRLGPVRDYTLSHIKALYPVSRAGLEYLDNLYPGHREKMHLRLLGSEKKDKDFITRCHNAQDKAITILSTARVSPEKRVLKNLDFVKNLASARKDIAVKWIHVGDGPQMEELRRQSSTSSSPSNLKIELLGNLPNDEIHRIYHEEIIDWTLLLSESEGTPIAICESFSYGVPVIATMVGGVPDMFTPGTGVLIAPDASSEEIVKAVNPHINDYNTFLQMKAAAHGRWKDKFNSSELRQKFAKELAALIDSRS